MKDFLLFWYKVAKLWSNLIEAVCQLPKFELTIKTKQRVNINLAKQVQHQIMMNGMVYVQAKAQYLFVNPRMKSYRKNKKVHITNLIKS